MSDEVSGNGYSTTATTTTAYPKRNKLPSFDFSASSWPPLHACTCSYHEATLLIVPSTHKQGTDNH